LKLVHRGLNVRPVLMGVPLDHRQRFVPADPLHSWQIDTGLNEMGDGGMAHRVPKDLIGVEPGGGVRTYPEFCGRGTP
jgi:hypothetical protein